VNSDQTVSRDGSQEEEHPSAELLRAAAQAATDLCLASEHFTQRISEIEDQIEEACSIDAVRVMRFRLTEYLQQLRDQTLRQRGRMEEALGQLREQMEIALVMWRVPLCGRRFSGRPLLGEVGVKADT
jgi:hypothetical protein